MPTHDVTQTNFKATVIDPGVTTGLVYVEKIPNELILYCTQVRDSPLDFLRRLQYHHDYSKILIVEDFHVRKGTPKNVSLAPAHLIGIIRAYAESEKAQLYLQLPMTAIGRGARYGSVTALKKAGVHIPGADFHHSMQAMSHFMKWFWFGSGYQYNDRPN